MISLSIIIPSYNTKDLLIKCLESLYHCHSTIVHEKTEIIVVDNGSTDGTVEEIKNSKLKIIENDKNLGFAKAVNQAFRQARGKDILLLNSDTVLENGTIEKMVKYLENNPEVGVIGCQLRNPDGSIQASGGYLPNLTNLAVWALFLDDLPLIKQFFPAYHLEDESFYTKKHNLGWVSGAFFLTKREIVDKVGLFDEAMFMYVEEVDWCQRVKNAGYDVVFNPEGSVVHYKGGSSQEMIFGVLEEFRGLSYFFQKYKPVWQGIILRIILKIAALARIILFGIILRETKKKKTYEEVFELV